MVEDDYPINDRRRRHKSKNPRDFVKFVANLGPKIHELLRSAG
jgi:hypothetical protein